MLRVLLTGKLQEWRGQGKNWMSLAGKPLQLRLRSPR
jgi:hypothetical protein